MRRILESGDTTMLCDLELIKDIHLLDGKEIVIWGAGNNGGMAYGKLKYMFKNPINFGDKVLFCDSDSKKWGRSICENGYVISPCELYKIAEKKEIVILIASDYVNEIVREIEEMQLMKMTIVCTWFGFRMAVYFHLQNEIFNVEFKERYLFEMRLNNAFLRSHSLNNFILSRRDFFYVAAYDQSIHVIQPGKVGSSTIVYSLQKRRIPCTHFHRLSFFIEDKEENTSKEDVRFCRKVFAELKERGIKIIIMVREPIARDISAFWFELDRLMFAKAADPDFILFFKKFLKEIYDSSGDLELLPFTSPYKNNEIKFGDQGKWFRETIEEHFGINVFAHPFDKERGYTIIRQDNIQMLILQMEKMNQLESVIGEFIGVENYTLENVNEAKSKLYYAAYQEFREKVELPRDYIERCYGKDSFIHHFYSKADQAKFLAKWEKHIE